MSCDFLLGLHGTTVDQILSDIRYVLEHHEPLGVDVFSLVPTSSYIETTFDGDIVRFFRLEYDVQATVDKIYANDGLPNFLADRLLVGR